MSWKFIRLNKALVVRSDSINILKVDYDESEIVFHIAGGEVVKVRFDSSELAEQSFDSVLSALSEDELPA